MNNPDPHNKIELLSEFTANQIAAGEVVERPASIVKELVENSLDAGARAIKVSVEQGGVKRIKVTDDGRGILQSQLRLALARHATSKLRQAEDLERVATLGFRGEALASAASVSRLTLCSKTQDEQTATALVVEGGTEISFSPRAHPLGTSVEVADLFFNTPARRKFLKTERTELTHVEAVVKKLALAHFPTAFTLTSGDRVLLRLPACTSSSQRLSRVQEILGSEFSANAHPVDEQVEQMRLWGWVGDPTYTRAHARDQYFFVNGRAVHDKLVGHAVRQAYRDVMFHGRYPVFAIYLELPASEVDVNVHPTKHEVRFRNSRDVHDFIFAGLNRLLRDVRPGAPPLTQPNSALANSADPQPADMNQTAGPNSAGTASYLMPPVAVVEQNSLGRATLSQQRPLIPATTKLHDGVAESNSPADAEAQSAPLGYALAQLQGIYVLAQNAAGMVLVDMHAAHERITYEALKKQLRDGSVVTQRLLVPVSVQVSPSEADVLEEHAGRFERLGLSVMRLGRDLLSVREAPVLLLDEDLVALVRDLLGDIAQYGATDRIEHHEERILAGIACRGSLRAHRELRLDEMNALLRQMEQTDNAGQCNHGRPTYRMFDMEELDRFFLRGQ